MEECFFNVHFVQLKIFASHKRQKESECRKRDNRDKCVIVIHSFYLLEVSHYKSCFEPLFNFVVSVKRLLYSENPISGQYSGGRLPRDKVPRMGFLKMMRFGPHHLFPYCTFRIMNSFVVCQVVFKRYRSKCRMSFPPIFRAVRYL